MSRYVDQAPNPAVKRDKKVFVASFGRNGTLGLYEALQILGYKPYHVVEMFKGGEPHFRMATEGIQAAGLGSAVRFGREQFDKFLGPYDSITDIPYMFLEDLVAAYPEAQFILTYREPEAWLRSLNNTITKFCKLPQTFPYSILQYFDHVMWHVFRWQDAVAHVIWRGNPVGTDAAALQSYHQHNKRVREIIPAGRLLEIKLEDGLGWEQFCPFLGHQVPTVEYPRTNDAKTFGEIVGQVMKASVLRAVRNAATCIAIPAVSIGIWYFNS